MSKVEYEPERERFVVEWYPSNADEEIWVPLRAFFSLGDAKKWAHKQRQGRAILDRIRVVDTQEFEEDEE